LRIRERKTRYFKNASKGWIEMPSLNTYKTEDISNFVRLKRAKKPWWLKSYGGVEKAEGTVGFQGLTLGIDFGKFLSSFTTDARAEFAAWEWLTIDTNLEDIDRLREGLRFDMMSDAKFCDQIRDACSKITREHPELQFWVRRRLALLELRASSTLKLSPETLSIAPQINIGLMGAQALLERSPTEVADEAKRLLVQALKAVGVLASQILCAEPTQCRFRVNLMIALKSGTQNGSLFADTASIENVATAARLWNGTPQSEEILAVVAETSNQTEFRGFWVPTYPAKQVPWPGAGFAYARAQGSAVFADDLPPILGVNDAVVARWTAYVQENFAGGFFVSLPLKLDIDESGPRAYAVININIYPNNGDGRRAYHSQWLNLVQQQTAPLLLEIYKAYMLLFYARYSDSSKPRFGDAVERLNLTAGIDSQRLQLPPGEQVR
jgi:hypothetical protein